MILILFMYSLFAASFTIAKILLSFLPPIFLIAVRMTIAGLILLFMYCFMNKKLCVLQYNQISWRMIRWSMVAWWLGFSIIHIVIPYVTEFIALESIAPSCSALIFNLTPFFSAFLSYLYFKELMTLKKWVGFLIGFFGIGWFVQSQSVLCIDGNALAYGLVLISVFFGALGWIYVRILVRSGYHPLLINGIAMLLAGLQSFVLAYFFESSIQFDWDRLHIFLFWLTLIIILTNIIFYNLYAYLLKRYSVTLLSFMGCVIPLFTAFFDWLFLGIHVSHQFFFALLIAGCGVYLFYQEELRLGYVKK